MLGSLEDITIPELFSILFQLRKTGSLSIVNEVEERGFLFYNGNVFYATSRDRSRRLGSFLVRLGLLAEEELEQKTQSVSGAETHLGQRFVEEGRLTRKQLDTAILAQVVDILLEVLAWRKGVYHFENGAMPCEFPGESLVSTQSVLLEAARITDERAYAGALFPDNNAVLVQGTTPDGPPLEPSEGQLLGIIDGQQTIEQILQASPRGPRATAELLRDLLQKGALTQATAAIREIQSEDAGTPRCLPVAPDVPARIFTLCKRPDASRTILLQLIAEEPVLAARLISRLTLRCGELRRSDMTLDRLVEQLGDFELRNLLFTEAVRGLYFPAGSAYWKEFWEETCLSALFCRELALWIGYPFPAEAYLAGLLHNLGAFVLLGRDPEAYRKLVVHSVEERQDLEALEEDSFGITHTAAGSRLAERWQFPRMLLLAIKEHHKADKLVSNPLLHILSVANGILQANGCRLGFQSAAGEQLKASLKRLQLDGVRAAAILHEVQKRPLAIYTEASVVAV
jgi:HD-like signal output (HDOD) protein